MNCLDIRGKCKNIRIHNECGIGKSHLRDQFSTLDKAYQVPG